MNMTTQSNAAGHQTGSSMVEVLVSLLILGVGLLGAVSLQSNGLNSNQRAVFVTEAQVLAQDMADRILAYGDGPAGANGGEYDDITTKNNPNAATTCAFTNTGCNPTQTKANDGYEWQQLFASANSSLPGAYGAVKWNDPVYTITIYWDQDRTGAKKEDCTKNDKSADGYLTCFQMELGMN